jgi:flagellar export protein FliJ
VQLEVARVRRRIDELTDVMAESCQAREKALQQTMQANRLQTMQVEINAAAEAKQILANTLHTLLHQRDAQMKLYRTAHSGRQMLTDLLDQKKNAYEHERMRVQQKRLDDIIASRWQRT